MSVAGGRPKNDHIVSRGLQQNFATEDRRVTVIDSRRCKLVDPLRAISRNFSQMGYTQCTLPTGERSDWLDEEFKKIESSVLGELRRVGPKLAGPKYRADVATLFALHLVRSESFRARHEDVVEQLRREEIPRLAADPGAIAAYIRDFGRAPQAGDIDALANRLLDEAAASKRLLTGSMARQHNQIVPMLNGWFMQVVWSEPPLPGFILGDVPVVHAQVHTERFGWRDSLAIGDANLIIGPLTRRVAVCFSATRVPHTQLKTRRLVDFMNSLIWKGSLAQIACHPDDSLATLQMARRIDRLPARFVHQPQGPG